MIKVRFNRWYNAVLAALLSMLGYGCESEVVEYGVPAPEYGAPHADYIMKGQVTDEAGNPIQGIKTSLHLFSPIALYINPIATVQTDALGNYQLKTTGSSSVSATSMVIFEDIDGEANGGEFFSDTIDVAIDKAVKTKDGDGKWYDGAYEITQNVKLKKK